MSLKKELKKAISDVLSAKGMPVLLDKTFNSMWEAFAKTQPSTLNTSAKFDPDIWGALLKNLEKFVMKPEHAALVIPKVKKVFGEQPAAAEIKGFMQ